MIKQHFIGDMIGDKLLVVYQDGLDIKVIKDDEIVNLLNDLYNENQRLNNDIMYRINATITDIMLYNNTIIEDTIKNLLIKGCSCGNKNIKQFVIIYQENEFAYIKCDICGNCIYPIGELITTEQIKKVK